MNETTREKRISPNVTHNLHKPTTDGDHGGVELLDTETGAATRLSDFGDSGGSLTS